MDIPFNNYITGFSAFTHKAGIHAKGVLNDPSTYEALKPEDFGLTRYIHIAHRLTGWNVIRHRAEQLGLDLTDDQVKHITEMIKALSDKHSLTLDDVDTMLHITHMASTNMVVQELAPTIQTGYWRIRCLKR